MCRISIFASDVAEGLSPSSSHRACWGISPAKLKWVACRPLCRGWGISPLGHESGCAPFSFSDVRGRGAIKQRFHSRSRGSDSYILRPDLTDPGMRTRMGDAFARVRFRSSRFSDASAGHRHVRLNPKPASWARRTDTQNTRRSMKPVRATIRRVSIGIPNQIDSASDAPPPQVLRLSGP